MSKITDPIADCLTRIRNGQIARHAQVEVPGSKLKFEIAKILEKNGYVGSVEWHDIGPQGLIRIQLKYDENDEPVIRSIQRVSKASRRRYVGAQEIPQVLNGLGISVLSTSKGVLSGKEARAANVGGELICSVY